MKYSLEQAKHIFNKLEGAKVVDILNREGEMMIVYKCKDKELCGFIQRSGSHEFVYVRKSKSYEVEEELKK